MAAGGAAGVPYTASQTSVLAGVVATYANLTNGDYTDGGCTQNAVGHCIFATYASPVLVSAVTLAAGNQTGIGGISTALNDSFMQYSTDNSTWTTFLTPSGFSGSVIVQTFTLGTPVTAQYFRLTRQGSGGVCATTEMVFT